MDVTTREIRVETSTVCNYHCVMCPRESLTRPRRTMANDLFEHVVTTARRELPQLEMCTVSGFGELAADRQWAWKLALAKRLFPEVHVVTNLSLISDAELPQLAEHTTEVRVSVYAADEASFHRVHRPNGSVTLAQIERRILRLVELGAHVHVTCCELEENRAGVSAFIDRWQGSVESVEVWRPHNWVTGRQYRTPADDRRPSCGRPASGPIQVQVDGTVNVCCFDFDGAMVIGDLRENSFAEILGGERLRRIRWLHATARADELPLCRVCDQRDPPDRKTAYLVHSPGAAIQRVCVTSSKRELIGSEEDRGPQRR